MTYRLRFSLCLLLLSVVVLLSVSCGGSTQETMAKIRKNKQIVVGTDAVNLPFEFGKGLGVQGFDVDIGEEIAKEVGVETRWVKVPFEGIFKSLENREVDFVISAITITDERQKNFAFSKPYFTSGQVVAIRREMEKVKSLADLNGLKIGVQAGTTGDTYLSGQKIIAKFDKKGFATLDDALLALNNREIDAVIGDYPIVSYSIFTSFPQLKTIGEKLTQENYGIVFRKNDSELVRIANKVLDDLRKSGRSDQIHRTWFGDAEKGIAEQKKQEAEWERLKITPKTIIFNFIKDPSFNFRMSRMDGFNVLLKNKATGVVSTSNPIETQGNTGTCRVNVVPGTYEFSMKGYPLKHDEFEVPVVPAMTLTSTINLGNQTTINPPK